MTEAEWLACTDPTPALEYLRGKAGDRKLRLFACACCRRLSGHLSGKHSRKALAVAERYSDGEVSKEKLGFAWGDARRAARVAHRQEGETAGSTAMWAVSLACEADIGRALAAVGLAARCEAYPIDPPRLAVAQGGQMSLLRCLFGNPFRPARIDPAWLTWEDGTVVNLARAAYDERLMPVGTLDRTRLAVLADALEEAGCGDADLLGHLRGPGPCVRGCWAIDLLTGRK